LVRPRLSFQPVCVTVPPLSLNGTPPRPFPLFEFFFFLFMARPQKYLHFLGGQFPFLLGVLSHSRVRSFSFVIFSVCQGFSVPIRDGGIISLFAKSRLFFPSVNSLGFPLLVAKVHLFLALVPPLLFLSSFPPLVFVFIVF